MGTEIHPTAVISDGAELDEDVSVGPYCVIGPGVKLGRATRLVSHVTIDGDTTLGEGNEVYPFASLGMPPQDLKFKGEKTALVIGSHNVIRESSTIHRASVSGDRETTLGDNNYLMAYVHIGHDCKIGSNVVIASYAGLGGHVLVEDHVFIGAMLGIHQFVRIGEYAMLGGVSRYVNDVPPYVIASGADRTKLYGLNLVGLKRKGFSNDTIRELKTAYRILFREKLPLSDAIKRVQAELPYTDRIQHLVEFVQANKRGICR